MTLVVVNARPSPTAVEHPVGLDELFFSTTDRRGIIRAGNSVFVRISRYSHEELIGSPHNIVRHPDMPSGAFELMWSRLLAGSPMGAYVENLAADGGTYWVFATVTPLGDGFLSVRSAPCAPSFAVVREVYRAARAEEARVAASGHHRGDVARYGMQYLEQYVRALGFESYESFMFDALVSEVSARRHRLGDRTWERADARGPAADLLAATTELDRGLAQLGERMAGYQSLASRLAPVSSELLASATGLEAAADHAVEASDAARHKVLSNTARVMQSPMHEAVGALAELAPHLRRALHDAREAGFMIALAQLHAEMVVSFANEMIDGDAPDGSAAEVGLLCAALHEDVTAMVSGIDGLVRTLRRVADHVDAAVLAYDRFGSFLAEWGRLAIRHLSGVPLKQVIGPIEHGFADSHQQLHALRDLARECRHTAAPIAVSAFDERLDEMRRAAYACGPAPHARPATTARTAPPPATPPAG